MGCTGSANGRRISFIKSFSHTPPTCQHVVLLTGGITNGACDGNCLIYSVSFSFFFHFRPIRGNEVENVASSSSATCSVRPPRLATSDVHRSVHSTSHTWLKKPHLLVQGLSTYQWDAMDDRLKKVYFSVLFIYLFFIPRQYIKQVSQLNLPQGPSDCKSIQFTVHFHHEISQMAYLFTTIMQYFLPLSNRSL